MAKGKLNFFVGKFSNKTRRRIIEKADVYQNLIKRLQRRDEASNVMKIM